MFEAGLKIIKRTFTVIYVLDVYFWVKRFEMNHVGGFGKFELGKLMFELVRV